MVRRLASSFDVTPVAISVAASGSTAVAPAVARAVNAIHDQFAATAIAIDDTIERLFAGDAGDSTLRLHSRAPVDDEVDSLPLDDMSVPAVSVAALATVAVSDKKDDYLESLFEALGFDGDQ